MDIPLIKLYKLNTLTTKLITSFAMSCKCGRTSIHVEGCVKCETGFVCEWCRCQGLGICRDCTYQQILMWIFAETSEKACVPRAEVSYLRESLRSLGEPQLPTDEQARFIILYNRISNSICNTCGRKPLCNREVHNKAAAILCSDCHFYWWCSPECRALDLDHSAVCGRPDAPRDTGPLAIMIVGIEK